MWPTASQLSRILSTEVTVGPNKKFVLPPGTVVICHWMLASRQEANFTQGSEFMPHRWIQEERDPSWAHTPKLVVPFGVGKRTCPGKQLAEREMAVVIAKTFYNLQAQVVSGKVDANFNFLLVPAPGMIIKFSEKS